MNGRKETGAVTPIGLLAEKLPSSSDIVRALPAIMIFVFFIGYVGSQSLAGGKIFQDIFGVSATMGLAVVAVLIVLCSFADGFLQSSRPT
jgi:sodium/proline symporter